MGEKTGIEIRDGEEATRFTRDLLSDLRALELMIRESRIESDVRRLGAEQEVFLVDRSWAPASLGMEVLAELGDDRFTTELGRFNLELNLEPMHLRDDCLARVESHLDEALDKLRRAARKLGAEVVLIGILPTLTQENLTLEWMAPEARYQALNDAMKRLRGGEFQIRIKGRDELILTHDNVMLEACNTSFQIHLQVAADDFAVRYNVAQAIAAPVLAAATFSPLLFGRQLWAETRIALFQQATDTRAPTAGSWREETPRVSFGRRWLEASVTEIFQEDIARFRVLFGGDGDGEDSLAVARAGGVPRLRALARHNGTVYRWNRPCYGVSEGKPHLRIENRYLPAGPTVVDEVANAALWYGLMHGAGTAYGDIRQRMSFGDARANFVAAARHGLHAHLRWPGRGVVAARELILEELLPLAHAGLVYLGIDDGDRERYLGIVEARVAAARTGAHWLKEAADRPGRRGSSAEGSARLVAAVHRLQTSGRPVHEWPKAGEAAVEEAGGPPAPAHYARVGQLMSTDLFTVDAGEPVDLAASVMEWRHVRHVPVEAEDRRLVGLLSHRDLLRLVAQGAGNGTPPRVRDVMTRELVTARPATPTVEAMRLMREHGVSCLPVVDDGDRLVGILTERDLMSIASDLLERFLRGAGVPDKGSQ